MIEIKGTKYCIDQDAYNYIVCLNRPKVSVKDGKESVSYPQVAFYSELEGCLEYIIKQQQKSAIDTPEMISLKEALQRMEIAREKTKAAIRGVLE